MTTEPTPNGNKAVLIPLREFIPIGSGLAGIVALIGFLSFWAVIPERVNKLEAHDKEQDHTLSVLQEDSAQRRELLAGALATLAQINDRTKRIEDHLISDHPSQK